MATYDEKYGLMFEGQGNQNWGLTLHIPEKVPLTTNSIFDTYDHMMAYVNNPTSSAIQGLTLAVVGETGDNISKNGLYLVTAIGTKGEDGAALNNGVVAKLAQASDVKGDADQLAQEFEEFVSANTEAHQAFQNAIDTVSAATAANATKLTEKAVGHVLVTSVTDETTGAVTYTIGEDDIASAATLKKVKDAVDAFFADADFAADAKDTLTELQEYIKSDVSGATAMSQAIADNKKAIEDEVARATSAETANADAITALTETVASNKADIEGKLSDETEARTTAITELSEDLYEKFGNAAQAINAVNNAITAETANRIAAIEDLDANVASENGTFVNVQVEQVDGKVTSVIVTESDIASATATTASIEALTQTVAGNKADIEDKLSAETEARIAAVTEVTTALTEHKQAYAVKVLELSEAIGDNATDIATVSGTVESIKNVTLGELKIKDVDANDKVLAVSEAGILSSTLSFTRADVEGVDSLVMYGKDSAVLGTVPVAAFIKDGMLDNVKLEGSELIFTFNTDAGKQALKLDVTDFLNADEVAALAAEVATLSGAVQTHYGEFDSYKETNNAAVKKIKEDIAALAQDIADEEAARIAVNNALTAHVATYEAQVTELEGAISDAEANAVATAKTNLEDAKAVIAKDIEAVDDKFGSSISSGYTVTNFITDTNATLGTISEQIGTLTSGTVVKVEAVKESNIVIIEMKGDNGISYTMDFQWLDF